MAEVPETQEQFPGETGIQFLIDGFIIRHSGNSRNPVLNKRDLWSLSRHTGGRLQGCRRYEPMDGEGRAMQEQLPRATQDAKAEAGIHSYVTPAKAGVQSKRSGLRST
jgi:hypothetical protein